MGARQMKVGVDGRKIPGAARLGAIGTLERARALGLDGVFFRSVFEMSPTLDPGELRAIRERADALGLYLETGLGSVNPYTTGEYPEIRALGGGDYRLGMERLIHACAAIGCVELWVGLAHYQRGYPGYFDYDRFRTDAPWPDQLQATERFLARLAPALRAAGCRLNVETHEEITTFEVVRLVEAVGPDAVGVTFDIANVLARAEDPVAAARRIAPYVRLTHVKDALLAFDAAGLTRHPCTCGEGVIDWAAILPILGRHAPRLHLSIENPTSDASLGIQIFDPVWQASHPELSIGELAEMVRLARLCERRGPPADLPGPEQAEPRPYAEEEQADYIQRSAAYLRDLLGRLGLADEPPAEGGEERA
jgi:sugar phosphate isomerase/epimerase